MNTRLLRQIHFTIFNRGMHFRYPEAIPKVLPSLEKSNPTQNELHFDYQKLSQHFKHPVFKDYVPTYYEIRDCIDTAWAKRYIDTYTTVSPNHIRVD